MPEMEDLAADQFGVVVALQVLVDELDRPHHLLGQAELELLEAGQAEPLAEVDHAAFRGPVAWESSVTDMRTIRSGFSST